MPNEVQRVAAPHGLFILVTRSQTLPVPVPDNGVLHSSVSPPEAPSSAVTSACDQILPYAEPIVRGGSVLCNRAHRNRTGGAQRDTHPCDGSRDDCVPPLSSHNCLDTARDT